ncbi:hypothetical protein K3M35_05220 [Rhodococcus sp. DMU2021]|uniref:hypothetical protein n=1 Tax=Rhodococcus sp. DMU2021 TaxID=2866997 RepID=UPI001C7CDA09|nr:hypothetical protein [Rhodococcus sp. DMU2021]MBX4168067.1 hypothetical protein [Rhodococcus sp. DMU2021]
MSATTNSTDVWIVVDPVQDYEQSLKILGVYGSRRAAEIAMPRLWRKLGLWRNGGDDGHLEIQRWRGDTLVSSREVEVR